VLVAGLLHDQRASVAELKQHLASRGIHVRMAA
jgi:imidazole glycerol phosphate synthase subunit HisF